MDELYQWFTANRKRAVLIAFIWTVLIFIACFIPGREVPEIDVPFIDKWVHLVLFGGFAFLWLCAVQPDSLWKGIFIFLVSCGVGYGVEVIQGSGWVTGRSKDMQDVLADSVGSALGIFVFKMLQKTAKKFAS